MGLMFIFILMRCHWNIIISSTHPVDKDILIELCVGILDPHEGIHHLSSTQLLYHLIYVPICKWRRGSKGIIRSPKLDINCVERNTREDTT